MNLKTTILAAVLVTALHGCERGTPPPFDLIGEWFAAHTEGDIEREFAIGIDELESQILVGDMLFRVTEPEEPDLEFRGDMTGTFDNPFVDMYFTLVAAAGYDTANARFSGSYETTAIRGVIVLDNPIGQPDTLTLILRRS